MKYLSFSWTPGSVFFQKSFFSKTHYQLQFFINTFILSYLRFLTIGLNRRFLFYKIGSKGELFLIQTQRKSLSTISGVLTWNDYSSISNFVYPLVGLQNYLSGLEWGCTRFSTTHSNQFHLAFAVHLKPLWFVSEDLQQHVHL